MNLTSVLFYILMIFCVIRIGWMLVTVIKSIQTGRKKHMIREHKATRDKSDEG